MTPHEYAANFRRILSQKSPSFFESFSPNDEDLDGGILNARAKNYSNLTDPHTEDTLGLLFDLDRKDDAFYIHWIRFRYHVKKKEEPAFHPLSFILHPLNLPLSLRLFLQKFSEENLPIWAHVVRRYWR